MILRLYGQGRSCSAARPNTRICSKSAFASQETPGARQIIRLDIDLVQTSCGYGVPLFDYKENPPDAASLGRDQGRGGRGRVPAREKRFQPRRLRNRLPAPTNRSRSLWRNHERRSLLAILVCLVGYLLGSIPFGLLLTTDGGPRRHPRHRVGQYRRDQRAAHRQARTLAAATLVLDAPEGRRRRSDRPRFREPDIALFAGLAAVLGHLFPVWLNFKGGKGVATGLGVLMAASLAGRGGSLRGLACRRRDWPGFVAWPHWQPSPWPPSSLWLSEEFGVVKLAFTIAVLVFVRHQANIRRLLAGTEPRIGHGKTRTRLTGPPVTSAGGKQGTPPVPMSAWSHDRGSIDRSASSAAEGVGPITYRRLLGRYQTPAAALDAAAALARAGGRPQPAAKTRFRIADGRARTGAHRCAGRPLLIFLGDADYPPLLAMTGRCAAMPDRVPATSVAGAATAASPWSAAATPRPMVSAWRRTWRRTWRAPWSWSPAWRGASTPRRIRARCAPGAPSP